MVAAKMQMSVNLLYAIRHSVSGRKLAFVESLGLFLSQRAEQGKGLLTEGVARGILSVATGIVYSVEELSEEIRVSADLIESCVLMSKIKGSAMVEEKIENLRRSYAFERFCRIVHIDKDIFISILRITLQVVEPKESTNLFKILKWTDLFEKNIVETLIALSRCTLTDLNKAVTEQDSIVDMVEHTLKFLTRQLQMNENLSLYAVRLAQGDFWILWHRPFPLISSILSQQLYMGPIGFIIG